MVLLLILGLTAVPRLRRETFPRYSDDQVEVRIVYPGASPADIEEAICQRVEDAIEGVSFVEEVLAEAREGVGVVTVTMEEGAQFSEFRDDIRTEVEAVDDFPEEAERPTIREVNPTDRVVAVAVTGPMSEPHLKAYCEELKDHLQRLDDLSIVEVQGFADHQIRIELPAQELMRLGLSVAAVAERVAQQSVDLPAGSVETAEREILIRFVDERRSPREFHDLVIASSPSGAEVRLGDIARITDRFELPEEKILFDGQRAGLLQISKTRTQDTLDAFAAVEAFVARRQEQAPPGVRLTLTQDVSSIVRDRLAMLVTNGWQGLVLVFLVLGVFFTLRMSFWVAMGLPVAFLGALFFMPPIGYSLNMITMVGLLLALGLLMDDAIVIAENTAAHVARGEPPQEAVVAGVREVKMGVLYSFLTTVCIFTPISFLSGQIGRVLEVMPVVLILVLSVSLIEAFLILPRHLAHAFRRGGMTERGRVRRYVDGSIAWLRDRVLAGVVSRAVAWRYLTLGIALLAFLASAALIAGGVLKFQAFPEMDGNVVEARVLLPQGTPLARTEAIVSRLTDALDAVNEHFAPRQPEGKALVQHVTVQFGRNVDAYETGEHVATVSVDLLAAETRDARIDAILARWRQEVGAVPDVLRLTFAEPTFGPAGRPIEILLQHDRLDTLRAAGGEAVAWLSRFRGVHDVAHDLRPGKPEVRLRLRQGATAAGLDALAVARQLRASFFGREAAEIQVGPEAYEIDVRLSEADQDSLSDLAYFHVTVPDGTPVPLGSVTTFEHGRSYARIARVDGQRAVRIQGDVDTRVANTAEVIRTFQDDLLPELQGRYPALRAELKGEAEETRESRGSLLRGFVLGLVGIYLLLSFQFRSYIEPVIVMLAIPLALVGVVWGHVLMGLDLSMPSMLGLVSLAGIVVNDSILLVEFIQLRRRADLRLGEAAVQASRARFRAILLTTLTTIAGLPPLLAERSLQAQILIPLATSLVFGLLASSLLILVVLPALYTVLGDLGLARDAPTAS